MPLSQTDPKSSPPDGGSPRPGGAGTFSNNLLWWLPAGLTPAERQAQCLAFYAPYLEACLDERDAFTCSRFSDLYSRVCQTAVVPLPAPKPAATPPQTTATGPSEPLVRGNPASSESRSDRRETTTSLREIRRSPSAPTTSLTRHDTFLQPFVSDHDGCLNTLFVCVRASVALGFILVLFLLHRLVFRKVVRPAIEFVKKT